MVNYVIPVAYIIGAYIASFIVIFLLDKLMHIAAKTKTTLDDYVINALHRPIRFFFLLLGIFLAIRSIYPDLKINGFSLTIIFTILVIVLASYTLSRILKSLFNWYGQKIATKAKTKVDDTLLRFLSRTLSIVLYVVAFLIILDKLGIEIGPLLAALGVAGLAVALALQDTLSNFFSGIYLSLDKPIRVGDFIELGSGLKGYVHDVGWRSTKIRTLPNNFVIIPNETIAKSIVTNYSYPADEMSVVIPAGVSYKSNLDKVEKVTIEVGKEVLNKVEGGVKDFQPFIRYNEFADSSINFSVILRVKTFVDRYLVTHEFYKALKKRFDKEGIEIPFPQRDVHMKK